MHGAAETAVKAVLASECFAGHPIEDKVASDLAKRFSAVADNLHDLAAVEVFHDGLQLVFGKRFDSSHRAGNDLAVASVRAEGCVVNGKIISLADVSGFLSDAEVRRTRMIVSGALIFAGRLDQIDHGLKLADIEHVFVDLDKVGFRDVLQFVFDSALILVDVDRIKSDRARCTGRDRVDINLF